MKTFVKTQIQPEEPSYGTKLMNHIPNKSVRRIIKVGLLCLLALSFGLPTTRARTITLSLEFTRLQLSVFDPYNPGQTYYTVITLVSSDVPPVTYDEVDSSAPNPAFGGSENGYGYGYYGDIGSAVNAATNGAWTLTVNKGDVSEKQYTFTVSASGLDNTSFPAVQITTPVDGNPAVSTNAAFAWTGPGNWDELDLVDRTLDYSFYTSDSPSPATTSWSAAPLPLGTNLFEVTYKTNAAAWITITTPLDNLSHPFTNWVGGAKLVDYAQSGFVTSTNPPTLTGDHALVAHYAFDDSGNPGVDDTGNGNDINCGSSWGPGHVFTTDAVAGGGALQFFGGSSMTPCDQAFTSWTNALSGSFTVSVWIKPSAVVGNDGDDLSDYNGQSVVYADNNNLGATPVALTGSKVAFRTTDPDGNDDTLHSIQSVTTGSYVHIVSTRDQITGEKKIYINGVLDNSDFASTESLTGAGYVSIGGELFSAYQGLVDDLQIYSGVLSASEVANLYANPGSTATNSGGSSSGHKDVAHYAFDDSGNLGHDSSPNGNSSYSYTYWGPVHSFTTDAIAGGGAVQFFGTSSMELNGQVLTNLNTVLAGSFSFSTWVKTTVTNGADDNNAFDGAVIFWAYNDHGNTNDTIPLSITGSKAAFTTRDHLGNSDTLHSLSSVNDGNYHLITVTRDQGTGEKKIYVDGNYETSEIGTTDPLNGNNYRLTIGGWPYLIDSAATNYSSYKGLLDDVQIYSGVLSDSDVAYLYHNPGSTVSNLSSLDFNPALNTTNLSWTTGGNAFWFVETTNTHDSISAAQAGAIGDNQETWIETTVTGPGTLSFWWQVSSEGGSDEIDFLLDGIVQTGISGDSGWQQQSYQILSGPHTLRWRYAKDWCCTDHLDTAFLDQVSFGNSGPLLTFSLTIIRETYASYQPFVTGQTAYFAFPGLSGSDTPISYHRVESPNNTCSANFGPTNGGAGANIFLTFDELANSLTNGNWKLWLNKNTPQEKLYTFTVSASSFTSNSLVAVHVLTPLDGASGILTNTPYQWTGPAGWSNLTVHAWQERYGTNYDYAYANLPVPSVTWPAGPVLAPGTNFFNVEYQRTSITNFVVSAPYPEWSVGDITYQSAATAGFRAGGTSAQPVALLNPHNTGGAFQFQFLSQVSFTHAVQYRTNLVAGSNWQTYSNVTGDGALKTIPVPLSIFNPAKQGFIRVSTQ
jgi:hypothetical protein